MNLEAPPVGKKSQDMNIFEKYQSFILFMRMPALFCITLMRRKVGLRRADPVVAGVTAFAMYLWATFPVPYHPASEPLQWLAAICFLSVCWQHHHRWKEFRRGERHWHTFSDGYSPVEKALQEGYRPLARHIQPLLARIPRSWRDKIGWLSIDWWTSEHRFGRVLEPSFVWIVGLSFYHTDFRLCSCLCFMAAAFAASERELWKQTIKTLFDRLDNTLETVVWQQALNSNSVRGKSQPRTVEATRGISTGIGSDILARVNKHQAQMVWERQLMRLTPPNLPNAVVMQAPDNFAAGRGRL